MGAPTSNVDALMEVLKPELEKLCRNCPPFGRLTMAVDIHDSQAGRITLGIETARKIASRRVE